MSQQTSPDTQRTATLACTTGADGGGGSLPWPGTTRVRRIAVLDPTRRSRERVRRVIRRLGHLPEAFENVAAMQAQEAQYDLVWVACGRNMQVTEERLAMLKVLLGDEVPALLATSGASHTALTLFHARPIDLVVTPPKTFAELYGALRRLFERRGFSAMGAEIVCGPYRFCPASDRVWMDGEAINLRPREFDLAIEFFSHPGRVLSRDWLYAMVWEDSGHDSRTLDTHVSRMRRKLRMPTAEGWTLRSESRIGYRLVVPAAWSAGAASAVSTSFDSEAGLSSGA